ncbi:unnamed protein product [Phyllotreta striolata]|uniref:Protein MIS12 homolog n=1 Tax=Phyllotreta striolata TaxID=444603 RepID=A0A9N9TGT3_PHYSR|nr:unnamed protein product [Phyllotreta striolata]
MSELENDICETQYYGFSVNQLMIDFEMMIKSIIRKYFTQLRSEIKSICDEKSSNKIDKHIHNQYLLYLSSVKDVLGKFEIELRNIMKLPDSMIEEFNKFSRKVSEEEWKKLIQELNSLKTQLVQEKVFLASLEEMKYFAEKYVEPQRKKVDVSKILNIKGKCVERTNEDRNILNSLENFEINDKYKKYVKNKDCFQI